MAVGQTGLRGPPAVQSVSTTVAGPAPTRPRLPAAATASASISKLETARTGSAKVRYKHE